MLIKVRAVAEVRGKIIELADVFRAKILDVGSRGDDRRGDRPAGQAAGVRGPGGRLRDNRAGQVRAGSLWPGEPSQSRTAP